VTASCVAHTVVVVSSRRLNRRLGLNVMPAQVAVPGARLTMPGAFSITE